MFSQIVTLAARALMLGLGSAILEVLRPLFLLQGISAEAGMQIAKGGSRWHEMLPGCLEGNMLFHNFISVLCPMGGLGFAKML